MCNVTIGSAASSSISKAVSQHPIFKALGGCTTLIRNNRTSTLGPTVTVDAALLGGTTVGSENNNNNNNNVESSASTPPINPKDYVLLYFSASWCPPCRQFTPILSKFYNQHKDFKNFEVVFCSWDQNDAEFAEYFKSHPQWLAVDRAAVDVLAAQYNIHTIPSLMVVDVATGAVVTRKGRLGVANDPSAKDFPWKGVLFSPHVNINAPKNAMLIGGAATFGATLLLWLFAQQDTTYSSGSNSSNNNNNNNSSTQHQSSSSIWNFIVTMGGRNSNKGSTPAF